jgi:hypothetical protein
MKTLPWVERWKDVGSILSATEREALGDLDSFIDREISAGSSFQRIVGGIDLFFRTLSSFGYDVERAAEAGMIPLDADSIDVPTKAGKTAAGRLTSAEIAFLADVRGFMDYAIRNGVTLRVLSGAIIHDLNELFREGFDFQAAKKRGFHPTVSGYAKITADSVRGVDDE